MSHPSTRTTTSLSTVVVTALLAVVSAVVLWVGFAPGIHCEESENCPTLDELRGRTALPEGVHLFDRHDRPYADVGGIRRVGLPLERIPDLLVRGFPAVEDRRFHEHGGVDLYATGRAAVENIVHGARAEGASTIAMQLVRTLWAHALTDVGPWEKKLTEARSAVALVGSLGHERVLELYLNSIYMGDGVYGVGAAARHYFGVPVDSLGIAEAATLIALVKTPERYDPREYPDRARARRDLVLGVLARSEILTDAEAEAARAQPMRTTDVPPVTYRRDYVTAAVRRELGRVAPELVGVPGLRIFTTIDPEVQKSGQIALTAQLDAIESGQYGRFRGEPYAEADGPPGALQGAVIAIDPQQGEIRGLVGGRSFAYSELDRALQTHRQIGSLMKPIIVAAALDAGRSLADRVSTGTLSIRTAQGMWSPGDHVDQDTLRMREVMVYSSNRAAVRVGMEVGLDRIDAVARGLGLPRPVPRYPASLLGSFEASLGEMTAIYAAFGNGGHRVEPHLIRRIETADGRVAWRRELPIGRVHALDPAVAFMVLDGLRGVVDEGTGWRVREHFRGPAGGKTGTTDEGRDAWFVGVTPGLAAGIWVGFDRPAVIVSGADAARLAAPAWGRWMADADPGDQLAWVPPAGVERAAIDGVTGEALPETCPVDGVRVRRTWVRTSLRPVRTGGPCRLAPPDPSMLDLPQRERLRVLFRIPEPTRRDTIRSP